MSKVTMPHTDRALSAVLWIVAMILMVVLLRFAGCGRSDDPWAAAQVDVQLEAASAESQPAAAAGDEA